MPARSSAYLLQYDSEDFNMNRIVLAPSPFARRVALWRALCPFLFIFLGLLCIVLCVRSFIVYEMIGPDYHLALACAFAVASYAFLRNFNPYR